MARRFKVHTKTGRAFRRNGQTFTPEPQTVDGEKLGWTPAQIQALLTDPSLYVEDLDGPAKGEPVSLKPPEPGTPEEALVAAAVAGEPLPGVDNTTRAEAADTPEHPRGRRGR